eukprot:gnl/MRDRNA2_/MRDRNA2_90752_c0_seq1.p1 gnl/MRDRNA2_/MRDRNA2_90752_c0~~gnl/MRDRNA2_/MRDRNA2_90752_c0_seq1.p1  ORF type:complete len:379 (-),score=64.38 gnl/MRDRNA2_/MRDRNA2_90752_c0_seq1:166-1302(-)
MSKTHVHPSQDLESIQGSLAQAGLDRLISSTEQIPGSLAHILAAFSHNDEKVNIRDLMDRVAKITRWSTFRNEGEHEKTIEQLKRTLQILKDFQARIRGVKIFEVIEALGQLQESLCAARGVSALVMKLLAHKLEEHFKPCPDAALMKDFSEDMVRIAKGTFGSTPVEISRWSQWKWLPEAEAGRKDVFEEYIPEAEKGKDFSEMFQNEENEFDNHVFEVLLHDIRKKYHNKSGGVIIDHLINTLLIATKSGRTGFLQFPKAWVGSLYDPTRTLLPWTTIGFIFRQFLRKHILSEKDVSGGTLPFEYDIQVRFDKFITVLIPEFVEEVSELVGVLEGQVKEVGYFKTKLLAYGTAAVITVGQILAALVSSMLRDAGLM